MPVPAEQTIRERLRALPVFERDLPSFDPSAAPEHPAEQFVLWLGEAIDAGVPEPQAMTLSTVDADGRPNARMLILKNVDDGAWQFATSRTSRKGAELAGQPAAAATFYWKEIGRQVRLRGRVLDAGAEVSAQDFLARPPGSRAAALMGHQSEPLADVDDLRASLQEAESELQRDPTIVPAEWTVYNLAPDEVEFWQADRERRHIRLQYRLDDGRWTRGTLWP